MQHTGEVQLPADFDIEADFDYRTMYCEADIIYMTGWSSSVITKQVAQGEFPTPLNPGSCSPVWSRAWVDRHYKSMLGSEPSAGEREKIEAHRALYEQTYEEALQVELVCPSYPAAFLEAEARRRALSQASASAGDIAGLRRAIYPGVIRDYAELTASWKARQAVRWLQ